MIIACPACDTRFQVDNTAFGATGRRLRCASCRHVWHFAPERIEPVAFPDPPAATDATAARVEAPGDPMPPPAAERWATPSLVEPQLRIEPPIVGELRSEAAPAAPRIEENISEAGVEGPSAEIEPALSPRSSVVLERRPSRRRWPLVGGGVVAALAAALLFAVFAPEQVMAVWPSTARLYAMVDLVAPPGAGLHVTLQPTRTGDALVVNGDIVNGAAVTRPIPPLRLTLRDGNKSDLVSQVVDPPVPRLSPGASVHFNAVFQHPDMAATKVDATFSTD